MAPSPPPGPAGDGRVAVRAECEVSREGLHPRRGRQMSPPPAGPGCRASAAGPGWGSSLGTSSPAPSGPFTNVLLGSRGRGQLWVAGLNTSRTESTSWSGHSPSLTPPLGPQSVSLQVYGSWKQGQGHELELGVRPPASDSGLVCPEALPEPTGLGPQVPSAHSDTSHRGSGCQVC